MSTEPGLEAARPGEGLTAALLECLRSGEAGAARAVDHLLDEAVRADAGDIHIEPWADTVSVRFRLDGILHEAATLPKEHHARIVSRMKVLARLAIYQKDLPQEGRIDAGATPCGRGMRLATFPTIHGEKAVVRVLDLRPELFRLDALGFPSDVTAALRDLLMRPQGTLLLTGPSSSGKTTTIYALLRELSVLRPSPPHIVTLEDPVEYRLDRVGQTEINPHAGFTFGEALRSVLRQDPEVIMVGEIRDPETARTAVQAGLTGHLVISTIHSGTAAGVFSRLLDMGVEPYLAASSVTGVLAQRLVRRVCAECARPDRPDPALLLRFGVPEDQAGRLRKGAGCPACRGTGYAGRLPVAELLPVSPALSDGILARARTADLHTLAADEGMRPLRARGRDLALEGETTLEELLRVMP
jgi:type II secretory ATPase GspE/PulE/Tfp pilus assembly ATPase PilB-like protein